MIRAIAVDFTRAWCVVRVTFADGWEWAGAGASLGVACANLRKIAAERLS